MGFSRQGYWSGLPCPPPGDLPNPGVFCLLDWQAGSLPLAPPGTPCQPWTHTRLPQELFQHPRQGLMWKSCLTFPRTAPPGQRRPEPPNVAPRVRPRLPRGCPAPPRGGVRDCHYLVRIGLKDSIDPPRACVFPGGSSG